MRLGRVDRQRVFRYIYRSRREAHIAGHTLRRASAVFVSGLDEIPDLLNAAVSVLRAVDEQRSGT